MAFAVLGMVWYGNAVSKPGGKERATPYVSLPTIEDIEPPEKLPISSPSGEELDERDGEEVGEGRK